MGGMCLINLMLKHEFWMLLKQGEMAVTDLQGDLNIVEYINGDPLFGGKAWPEFLSEAHDHGEV